MTELFSAVLLAIILEGLLYAAFPDHMKKVLASLMEMQSQHLRLAALVSAGVALLLLFAIRSL